MRVYDLGCEYLDYEPNEHCRCVLLGYNFRCGSKTCKEAILEDRESENAKSHNNKGVNQNSV